MLTYAGFEIREDAGMVDEDWSGVRSPGRARRRRALGYPQRIVVTPKKEAYRVGRMLVMHPLMAYALRRAVPLPTPEPKRESER